MYRQSLQDRQRHRLWFCGIGKHRWTRRGHRRGFSLIELLVTIAIVAFLMALLLPALNAAKELARRTMCGNNMRGLVYASLGFRDSHNYVPGTGAPHTRGGTVLKNVLGNEVFITDRQGADLGSHPGVGPVSGTSSQYRWGQQSSMFVLLLPYLDQEDLFHADSRTIHEQAEVREFFCPSATEGTVAGHSDYAWNAGFRNFREFPSQPGSLRDHRSDGFARVNYFRQGDVLSTESSGWERSVFDSDSGGDGESNIIALAERARLPCNNDFYYHGYPSTDTNGNLLHASSIFSSYEGPPLSPGEQSDLVREAADDPSVCTTRAAGNHPHQMNVAFADGHVQSFSYEIDARVWKAMCGIADSNPRLEGSCGQVKLEEDPPVFNKPCPDP